MKKAVHVVINNKTVWMVRQRKTTKGVQGGINQREGVGVGVGGGEGEGRGGKWEGGGGGGGYSMRTGWIDAEVFIHVKVLEKR